MTAPKPCPVCGDTDHALLLSGLDGVQEQDDCNEDTYRLIVHAADYIAHLEAQLASLPALVEACEELVRSVDEYCHRGLEKRHGHLLDCDAARAALALVKGETT